MSFTSLALALASSTFASPSVAPVDLGDRVWIDASLRIGTRLGEFGDDEILFTSTIVDVYFPLGPGHLLAEVTASSFAEIDSDEWQDVWSFTNPLLGYTVRVAPEARVTFAVALPFVDGDEMDDVFAALSARSNQNLHDPWTWFPSALSLVLGADVETPIGPHMAVDAAIRLAALVPVGGEGEEQIADDTVFAADVEAGFRFDVVRLGLGFVLFDEEAFDDDQFRFTGSLGVRVPVASGTFYADLALAFDDPALFDDDASPSILFGWTSPL